MCYDLYIDYYWGVSTKSNVIAGWRSNNLKECEIQKLAYIYISNINFPQKSVP